jgi:hypothetical protein
MYCTTCGTISKCNFGYVGSNHSVLEIMNYPTPYIVDKKTNDNY